uniref:Uncharacterized protein n=1 Tax=Oryza sativa subsp. japonica TaxID=39947 RepID=Q6ZGF6_ORYSJ|nr:hypothetical protein [Oryza sativa Japonica Group]
MAAVSAPHQRHVVCRLLPVAEARVGVMEFGWALRRPMRLPDSPRHERGLPAALRGVGVKPEASSVPSRMPVKWYSRCSPSQGLAPVIF